MEQSEFIKAYKHDPDAAEMMLRHMDAIEAAQAVATAIFELDTPEHRPFCQWINGLQ